MWKTVLRLAVFLATATAVAQVTPPAPQSATSTDGVDGPGFVRVKAAAQGGTGGFVDVPAYAACRYVTIGDPHAGGEAIALQNATTWSGWRTNPWPGDTQTVCCRPQTVSLCQGAAGGAVSEILPYTVLGGQQQPVATCTDQWGETYTDSQTWQCGQTGSGVAADGNWNESGGDSYVCTPNAFASGCTASCGGGTTTTYDSCGNAQSVNACNTQSCCTPGAPSCGACSTGGSQTCGDGCSTWQQACTCDAAYGADVSSGCVTCPAATVSWGDNCSASVLDAATGGSTPVTFSGAGYSGSGTATCGSGGWSVSGTCAPTAAATCAAGTVVAWGGGCTAALPSTLNGSAPGDTDTVTATPPYAGSATVTCSSGSASASGTCTPPACSQGQTTTRACSNGVPGSVSQTCQCVGSNCSYVDNSGADTCGCAAGVPESWSGCAGTTSAVAPGSVVVTNTTSGYTGQATYTCAPGTNGGNGTVSGPPTNATCNAQTCTCAATTDSWGSGCTATLPSTACGATQAPANSATVSPGPGYTGSDTQYCIGSGSATTGTWSGVSPSASCGCASGYSLQNGSCVPASCSAITADSWSDPITHLAGCSGNLAGAASGSPSTAASNASCYTGSETRSCSFGAWGAATSASCGCSAGCELKNGACVHQTCNAGTSKTWLTYCSAPTTQAGAPGDTMTLTNTNPGYTGSRLFNCTGTGWTGTASESCTCVPNGSYTPSYGACSSNTCGVGGSETITYTDSCGNDATAAAYAAGNIQTLACAGACAGCNAGEIYWDTGATSPSANPWICGAAVGTTASGVTLPLTDSNTWPATVGNSNVGQGSASATCDNGNWVLSGATCDTCPEQGLAWSLIPGIGYYACGDTFAEAKAGTYTIPSVADNSSSGALFAIGTGKANFTCAGGAWGPGVPVGGDCSYATPCAPQTVTWGTGGTCSGTAGTGFIVLNGNTVTVTDSQGDNADFTCDAGTWVYSSGPCTTH